MRFLIALICATIFVLSLTVLGIQYFYYQEDVYRVPIKVFKLEHLTEQETRDLFAELNIPWDPKPERPNLDIPSYQGANETEQLTDRAIPSSTIDIPTQSMTNNIERVSVLADITVNPDGSVGEVFILGGDANGKYTQQITSQIQEQSFTPRIENGEAVEYQFEEVIEIEIADK